MSGILDIKHLSFSYQKGVPVLKDFSLSVEEGEIIGILGPNGVGKSTLFEIISGQLKKFEGDIFLADKPFSSYSLMERARLIAYIRQAQKQHESYQDVFHFVLDGRRPYSKLGNYSQNDFDLVNGEISRIGLSSFMTSRVSSLSGGEFQRCVLARAIVQQTRLIICDEPFSAMDVRYQKEFRNKIIAESRKRETAFLISIHDINLARQFCTKILFLKHGEKHFFGRPDEISCTLLEQVYDTPFHVFSDGDEEIFM